MRQLSEETQERIRLELSGLDAREQEVRALKIIASDFLIYCERNLMIKDKDSGGVIPLVFNWEQRVLVERVLEDLALGKPVRYIVLKARQMGISTVIEALCYWWTATHKNINSAIVAHEKDAAVNLYKMFRRFYENSHPKFQPSLKYNTKADLTFDVEDSVKQEYLEAGEPVPGLGSEIATMVAKEDVGRSGTNHFVHCSEVGAWDSSADVVSGLLQTVPLAPRTFIFLESTAKGVGNYFFSEWMSAERGESQFTALFLPWHDHADYELEAAGGRPPYTEREKKLIFGDPDLGNRDPHSFASKGYDAETVCRKIAWRRRKMLDFVRDPAKFDQEYPDSPMVAFLSSGNYAFSVSHLLALQSRAKAYAKEHEVPFAELVIDKERKVTAKEVEFGPLRVFKGPVKGRKYVIGADVAEGIEVSTATGKEGDYSVADVMDAETYETVAKYRGHIDPDLFGLELFKLGTYYNGALLGVEANNHGIVTIQKLKNLFYRNLYQREPTPEEQEFGFVRTTLLGWLTNRKTKPLMVSNLAAAIREGEIIDYDLVFAGEAMVYVSNEKGVYGGKGNGHDDTVMAKAIALQLADWGGYGVQYAKERISKQNSPVKNTNHGRSPSPFADDRRSDRAAAAVSGRRAARAARRSR